MAEAEDVIVDAARHATAYAQHLLQRRRAAQVAVSPTLTLPDVAPRLDLLLAALHGRPWPLRVAQPPARITPLGCLLQRDSRPWRRHAVPATDGLALWLPRELDGLAADDALLVYRAMAVQQARRGSSRDRASLQHLRTALQRDLYLALEAGAADATVAAALPGLRPTLQRLRDEALRRRPPLASFAPGRRPLEAWLRGRLAQPLASPAQLSCADLVEQALSLALHWPGALGREPLLKDWWTGAWPDAEPTETYTEVDSADPTPPSEPTRSARLTRRPTVRRPESDEDDAAPGAWMIQTAQPHEHAEDPMGLQRPVDRGADDAPEGHAESVSELAQARLVRTHRPAHEVLLSDDAPPTASRPTSTRTGDAGDGLRYPEWDWRAQAYRDPGTTVWELPAPPGAAAWVEHTLREHHVMVEALRRRFEMLRAHRVVLRRQEDGDEIDTDAAIEARADVRAGAAMPERLYRSARLTRRDAAVLVLVDASGSTDAWIAGRRRIIDVEREALLLLSIALDGTGDPHAIVSFSGEGPQHVTVRMLKRFGEHHHQAVSLRIAGVEPERYTRAGAALRHASQLLQAQQANHRLLLLLSDGKPNDRDEYDGRYGIEDMRQAVLEARAMGLSPFCLTVDRQAAAYLPRVFGPHHHALLPQTQRLPAVLLEWIRRLLTR